MDAQFSPNTLFFSNNNPDSLLLIAIGNNDAEEVARLLKAGADPNKASAEGLQATPLMLASAIRDGKIMKMLLQAGAKVNTPDINGDPALNWAVYYGHIDNMKTLIAGGAELESSSKHGNALDVAYRLWHADSVINVFKGTALEKPVSPEVRKFLTAVKNGDQPQMEKVLSRGVSPNTQTGLGMPALHLAVRSGKVTIVEWLLKKGADPNILNRVGQTSLTIAARFGRKAIMKSLIRHQADVNFAGSEYALTPLIGAAVNGQAEVIELLLEAGADIDHQEVINQATALHWAIFRGNVEAALSLLEAGADYDLSCLDGAYNAYTLALAYDYTAIKRKIESMRKD